MQISGYHILGAARLAVSNTLDEFELELIHALQLRPRAEWAELAHPLGVSSATVARRWRSLRERGLGDEVGGQGVVKVVQRERHQGSCGSGSTEHNDRLAAMSNIRG